MGSRDTLPPVQQQQTSAAATQQHSNKETAQSQLLLSRRWSLPGLLGPSSSSSSPIDLYSHYLHGVNENAATMRDQRKVLYEVAKEARPSRAKHQAAYDAFFSAASTTAVILAWSRGKYKDWVRRHPQDADCEDTVEGKEQPSTSGSLTRKNTVSRTSGRSRESAVRKRSQSTMDDTSDGEDSDKPNNIRTFWWYCGVIKALCKLGLDMQRLSMRKTEQTALSELYYVSVSGTAPPGGEEDNQILFFDKTLFTRKRAACRVPEWAQNLMIRRPEQRKPEDVHRLKNLLMSMRSFREKYTDDMRTKMCEVVRYTRCDKGRVVLRQGHLGHYFYFIFSGSVFIQIDTVDGKTGHINTSTENIIRTGESFGEIALLGDGVRSATVICREPTELCQIDKATFLDICPALFQEQLDEKISFAKRFELFDSWDHESIRQLVFVSQVLYIPHGRVLELDWSQAQYVYFVMRGRISLIKEFDANDMTSGEEDWSQGEDWDWEEEAKEEEQEDRYNVLAAGTMMNEGSELAHKGRLTGKRFAHVGTLRAGHSTDLRILSYKPPKVAQITLLSEGVRVLRIAVRNFSRFAPHRHAEDFLKKRYLPLPIPSTRAIVKRYVKDLNWKTFRKRVMGTLERERAGQLVATIPASTKGTSGWSRWPGFDPRAEEKSGLLSERGAKSEIDDFPLVRLPPPELKRRPKTKSPPPRTPDFKRSLTMSSSGVSHMTPDVTNDRTLVLYPPTKHTYAFMRKSLTKS